MKYENFVHFLAAAICLAVFAGCSLPAMPQRQPITFDYAPKAEAAPGSADVTFVVVGTQLAKVAQPNTVQSLLNHQVPLLDDLLNSVTNDLIEALNARGYSVTGPYETYSEIMHPVKEGSDLLLTAEVNFVTNTRNIRRGKRHVPFGGPDHYTLVGSVNVICDVKLVLLECLTNEPMWTKNVTLKPFDVVMDSIYPFYTDMEVAQLAALYGSLADAPIEAFLEQDNKFYSDFGRALERQYRELLGIIYTYLDPKEMAIVKNQAMELRRRKVY